MKRKTTVSSHHHSAVIASLLFAMPWIGMAQVPAPSGGGAAKGAASTGGSSKGASGSSKGAAASTAQPATPQQPATAQPPITPQQPGAAQPNMPQQAGAPQPNTPQQPGTAQQPVATQPNTPQQSGGQFIPNIQPGAGTTSSGTIGTFAANLLSLLSSTNGPASNFQVGPDTVFTDSEGRIVSRDRFTSQTPATVFYSRSGNDLIATKVVIKETPGAFSAGTVTEVSPGIFVIEQPGASATPVRYVNNKTTNYVDQNGEAVSPEMIKPGTPVKVFYTKVGDTLMASKVEVQSKRDSGLPKPPVSEDPSATRTTTTITRETKP